jgi:peptide/nickel transport system substrate-binding protein
MYAISLTLCALVFAAMPVFSVAAACDEDPFDLVVDTGRLSDDPRHFNWFLDGADRNRGASTGLLEPLFTTDPRTGKTVGWLATEAEWIEEGRLIRLHLRRNIRWSDGTPFKAQDVAFSLGLVKAHPSLDGLHADQIRAALLEVKVEDDRHLLLTLHPGHEDFVDEILTAGATDAFAIVQSQAWQGVDPSSADVPPPIGTGPYMLDMANADHVLWRRNPDWWGARTRWYAAPKPERLVWRSIAADEIRAWRLTRGCSDIASDFSPGLIAGLTEIAPATLRGGAEEHRLWSEANWTGLFDGGAATALSLGTQMSQWALYGLQPVNEKMLTLRHR